MTSPRRTLRAGEILFSEGDAPTGAYLIESGELEMSTVVRGRRLVLSRLRAGELVGEMAVFDDGPRATSAVALVPSVLYAIDPGQVTERLAKTDPVIRALIESLLHRYRSVVRSYREASPRSAFEPEPSFEQLRGLAIARADAAAFDQATPPEGVDKLRLESELRQALADDGLDVRYQPILHIASGRIAGYEALIRWNHPERGQVSPMELVGLAEESALIVAVGEYVFDTACRAVTCLIAAGATPAPFIAVNVSARQLQHPGLVQRIVERVEAAAVPRGSLKIELTESQSFDDAQVETAIALCHRHGIGVALDDFGTGYSHLARMHRLQFDTLKIDQGFTRALLAEPRVHHVVEAIVAMARALGAQIVAEGVESDEVLEVLRALGCDYAQGFLIGQAEPLQHWVERLRAS